MIVWIIIGFGALVIALECLYERRQSKRWQRAMDESRQKHYAEIDARPEPPVVPAAEVLPFHLRHARGRRG